MRHIGVRAETLNSPPTDQYRRVVHAMIVDLQESMLLKDGTDADTWSIDLATAHRQGDLDAVASILEDQLEAVQEHHEVWSQPRAINLAYGLELATMLPLRFRLSLRAETLERCAPYLADYGKLPERVALETLPSGSVTDDEVEAIFDQHVGRFEAIFSSLDKMYQRSFGPESKALIWLADNLELFDHTDEANRVRLQVSALGDEARNELSMIRSTFGRFKEALGE